MIKVPLPPLPTLFESNTPFPEVQKVLDAFDDYLAYRYVVHHLASRTRSILTISTNNLISEAECGMLTQAFQDLLLWRQLRLRRRFDLGYYPSQHPRHGFTQETRSTTFGQMVHPRRNSSCTQIGPRVSCQGKERYGEG